MNYTGQFKNINNKNYQVDIDVNNGISGSNEILFSDEPFTVEYNNGSTIFEPLKLSNATCTIISDNYLFDIYSSGAKDVKLTLTNKDLNTCEWVGYITPNLYNQGFEKKYETVEIEAIDGLSILENYKYETIDSNQKKIKSFQNILLNVIKKSDCYKTIYINLSNNILSGTTNNILSELFITEQNFFDEDDEPMTNKEVLEEIIKFLGCTLIPYGDSLYILDYDYIIKGYTDYIKLSTSNNWLTYTTQNVTLNHIHQISTNDFKSNGASIELSEVYNCASVKTNLYKKDTLLPDFFDKDKITNYNGVAGDINDYWYKTLYPTNHVFRYYTHENFKSIYYDNDIFWNEIDYISMSYDNTTNYIGATITKYGTYSLPNAPAQVTLNNYILFHRHLTAKPTTSQNIQKPVLTFVSESEAETSYLFDNYYIILNGSALWDDRDGDSYIDESRKRENDDDFVYKNEFGEETSNNLRLVCRLKIGNKFWNGTIWTLTDSNFVIYFDRKGNKHFINSWFDIKNNVKYSDNLSETGQKIKISKTDNLVGAIEFSFFTPQSVDFDHDYRVENVWLKDFEIKIIKKVKQKDNDSTDTQYKNIINESYVNEFSDIDLKVCSQTEKGMSYSAVLQKPLSATNYTYNSNIYNKGLGTNQKSEFNIIQKYVNQYSNPQRILNLTLGNDFKPYSILKCDLFYYDNYIIDSMSIDYKNETNEIKMINKV